MAEIVGDDPQHLGYRVYVWTEISNLISNDDTDEIMDYIEELLGDIPDRVESLETGAVTIDSSYSTLSALQSALSTLSPHKIYLIPASGNGTNNSYDEYIVKNGALEKIGTKELSLTGYFKTSDFKSTLYNSVTSLDCTTAHAGVNGATEDAINIKINFAD